MTTFDWRTLPLPDPTAPQDPPPSAVAAETMHAAEAGPALPLTLTTPFDGDGDPHNACLLVGTVLRAQDRREDGRDRRSRRERVTLNALGGSITPLFIEVAEPGAEPYRLRLTLSARLLALHAPLFVDQQRVTLAGALRMDRTYDRRFAEDDLDAGMAQWELRLDVVVAHPATDADPDGTWVRLTGEVAGDPVVRGRPNGQRSVSYVASVRLHDRRAIYGAFAHSRALRPVSTVLPAEVALSGVIPDAGALLKRGNTVGIEGRLAPYAMRRRVDATVEAALARQATRVRAQGGTQLDQRVAAAQRRLLTAQRVTIEVGFVELRNGTPLDDTGIAQLIADHERTRRNPPPRPTTRPTNPEQLDAALDVATAAALATRDEDAAASVAGAEARADAPARSESERVVPAPPTRVRPHRPTFAPVTHAAAPDGAVVDEDGDAAGA